MAACALAAQSREKEYLEVAGRYNKQDLGETSKALGLLVEEMEAHEFTDRLGNYYMDITSKSSKKSRGEFYTPDCVSELAGRILFESVTAKDGDPSKFDPKAIMEGKKPFALLEPCCGAGGMILKAAEQFSPVQLGGEKSYVDLMRVTAIDINPVACDMTYINVSLWGIPARVIQGNYVTKTITIGYKNIHWMRVGEDQRIMAERMIEIMRWLEQEPEKEIKPEPQKPSNSVSGVDVQRNPEPPKRENYDQPELF